MAYSSDQNNLQQLCKEYAEGIRRTVFFVGAGGSVEVGMPTWSRLRSLLMRRVEHEFDQATADHASLARYHELEAASHDDDAFWQFFTLASRGWPTTYADFMREQFDEKLSGAKTSIPMVYSHMWRMRRLKQIFTLNVDGLVSAAFYSTFPNRRTHQLLEYDGFSVTDALQFLARDAYCVVNLHGVYTQKTRWIMDGEQRERLHGGSAGARYAAFAGRLFSEYNVVFVGMNPADIAVSPFLAKAAELGMIGQHYWICPSPEQKTRDWAQKNGVRLIVYNPPLGEDGQPTHSQDICAILNEVETFTSVDKGVDLPEKATPIDPSTLPEPLELIGDLLKDTAATRSQLEGAISYIGREHGYSSRELVAFLNKYNTPLEFASKLDKAVPGLSQVHNYEVVSLLQKSGVSSVWTARNAASADEEYRALKALSPDKLDDVSVRQSFRRGIESIFLLGRGNSAVAPKYIDHSELPLSVVMEFIPGGTLSDLKSQFGVLTEEFSISLFKSICEAVRVCHLSEGQVLHRDVKPGNILLEGWHSGYELDDAVDANIRLINFDLSWHRFTSGDTKSISAEDIGYYAPEQRYSKNSAPPRSAETDVYMLGMVLYYLFSDQPPPDGGSRLSDWPEMVRKAVAKTLNNPLARARARRLIADMTYTEMDERADLNTVIGELESLLSWLKGEVENIDSDFIVENLAIATGREYHWDRAAFSAEIRAQEAAELRVSYRHRGNRAALEFFRQKAAGDMRAGFGPKLAQKIGNAAMILGDAGWDVTQKDSKGLKAEIRISELKNKPNFGTEGWGRVVDSLLSPIS